MSDYVIRKIEKSDLQRIVKFHKEHDDLADASYRDIFSLEWMLRDPFNPQEYNGFVAESKEGRLLGLIGYSRNEYQINDETLVGVIPMSWLVAPSERGILGIRLLLAVFKQGDFIFAMGGTKIAQAAYKAAKLKLIGKAQVFTRVVNFFEFNSYKGRFISKEFLKSLLFLSLKHRGQIKPGVKISPIEKEWIFKGNVKEGVSIIPTFERNSWMMECPDVESYAFSLEYHEKAIGNCICYINIGKRNIKKGRIIFLPFAGNDKEFYRQTINILEEFLIEKGCCSISLISDYSGLNKALKSCGYRTSSLLQGYPLYIRLKSKRIKESDFTDWFLSYYESNKGHLYF